MINKEYFTAFAFLSSFYANSIINLHNTRKNDPIIYGSAHLQRMKMSLPCLLPMVSVSCLTYCLSIYNRSWFVCFAWLNVRIRSEDPRVHFTWQKLWRETEKVTLFFIWFDKDMFTHLHKISFCLSFYISLSISFYIMSIVWFSFPLLLFILWLHSVQIDFSFSFLSFKHFQIVLCKVY